MHLLLMMLFCICCCRFTHLTSNSTSYRLLTHFLLLMIYPLKPQILPATGYLHQDRPASAVGTGDLGTRRARVLGLRRRNRASRGRRLGQGLEDQEAGGRRDTLGRGTECRCHGSVTAWMSQQALSVPMGHASDLATSGQHTHDSPGKRSRTGQLHVPP